MGISLSLQAWGNVTSFSPSQFRRLGHLAVGISAIELSRVVPAALGCSDTGYALGQSMRWSASQVTSEHIH